MRAVLSTQRSRHRQRSLRQEEHRSDDMVEHRDQGRRRGRQRRRLQIPPVPAARCPSNAAAVMARRGGDAGSLADPVAKHDPAPPESSHSPVQRMPSAALCRGEVGSETKVATPTAADITAKA